MKNAQISRLVTMLGSILTVFVLVLVIMSAYTISQVKIGGPI